MERLSLVVALPAAKQRGMTPTGAGATGASAAPIAAPPGPPGTAVEAAPLWLSPQDPSLYSPAACGPLPRQQFSLPPAHLQQDNVSAIGRYGSKQPGSFKWIQAQMQRRCPEGTGLGACKTNDVWPERALTRRYSAASQLVDA
jgi:hypothetical protein